MSPEGQDGPRATVGADGTQAADAFFASRATHATHATHATWPWWKEAVFYQIYPRSFCLADPEARARRLSGVAARGAALPAPPRGQADGGAVTASGPGDLEGIRHHLDHLVWLGVDAIWLSPFYRSPMRDFGYDVSDYCDVDPLFGSNEDFDLLLQDAHEAGLRVIVDLVPNHTSDQHPWFLDARSSRDSAYRDFYIWRDPDRQDPSRPPNNWRRAFGNGPAWTFDETSGQWYLHLFLPEQPDLDWTNPAVALAMDEVMGHWLKRGVDGFRIDVAHGLGKDPALLDAPAALAATPWSALNDDERTHPILRHIRDYVDNWPQAAVIVGEVFLLDIARVAKYYGHGDELHLAFNFAPMFCPFEAACFKDRVAEIEEHLTPRDAWPTWVLSSHDRPRQRTRYGGSERRARAGAVLLLTMRGTPFLYAGEELGLSDAVVSEALQLDPGGRDGCRAPIPWDGTPEHGWALDGALPWLPFPPAADSENVAALAATDSSILNLYRRLLALRRATEVLRRGELELLDTPDEILAVRRHGVGEERWIAVNFSQAAIAWQPPAPQGSPAPQGPSPVPAPKVLEGSPAPQEPPLFVVELTTGGQGSLTREGAGYEGQLGPEEAVILRPAPPDSCIRGNDDRRAIQLTTCPGSSSDAEASQDRS
ncbi:MAG: alpha-amylase family glycosyl hydrolase [Acidimicrobiales bacterium]